jgi:hypothetical protein
MTSKSDWFLKALKVSSAWNPIAAVFLQLQSELDDCEVNRRLDNLEDPINSDCKNATELCKVLYSYLRNNSEALTEETYIHFSGDLAYFEAKGYLKRQMQIGSSYPYGIESLNHFFILYLARLFDGKYSMSELYTRVDDCDIGVWINGVQLAEVLNVPVDVVRSVFQLYVEKGFGIVSNETGTCNYIRIA